MFTPVCPACRTAIAADDINVGADVAFCRACNLATPLSGMLDPASHPTVKVDAPPPGAWRVQRPDSLRIGATLRTVVGALAVAFFALFWNGIVGVFVVGTLAATLQQLGLALPAWLPAPGFQSVPVIALVGMWIFLTPFLIIGLGMLGALMLCLVGRCEVTIDASGLRVFTGVGRLGRTRRVDLADVAGVSLQSSTTSGARGSTRTVREISIQCRSGEQVRFGSGLSESRRVYVAGALREALRPVG